MALGEYGRMFRRRWLVIVGVLVLAVAASLAWSAMVTPKYQARAQLYVSTVSTQSVSDLAEGSSFTQRQVTTYADVARSPYVLDPVIEELGLDVTAQELAESVVAQAKPGTVLINLSATHPDPQLALALTEAIGDQVVSTLPELDQAADGSGSPVSATLIAEAALVPEPVAPQTLRNLVLGAVAGLVLGLGLALLRELTDLTVRGEDDLRVVTTAPVLGGVPFDARAAALSTVVIDDPYNPHSEAMRTIRTNLTFVNAGQQPRVLVVTSSVAGEGKTTTSAHLALTLAANGQRVCLVEADLRRPGLSDHLGLDGNTGLTTVLIGQADVSDVLQPFGTTGVSFLGSGQLPPNPSELVGSPRMKELLSRLRDDFDITIVDSPPLCPVTDAAVLAGMTDGALVVVGVKVVRRDELSSALKRLEMANARLLGLVLNRLPARSRDGYAYIAYHAERSPHPSRRSRRRVSSGAQPH